MQDDESKYLPPMWHLCERATLEVSLPGLFVLCGHGCGARFANLEVLGRAHDLVDARVENLAEPRAELRDGERGAIDRPSAARVQCNHSGEWRARLGVRLPLVGVHGPGCGWRVGACMDVWSALRRCMYRPDAACFGLSRVVGMLGGFGLGIRAGMGF